MTQYRPIPDEQVDVFEEYLSYAFTPKNGPVGTESDLDSDSEDNSEDGNDPIDSLGSRRGL